MGELVALAGAMEHERVRLAPEREGAVVFAGGEAARERVWIQCTAAAQPAAALLASWAVLEALTTERVSRLRQPVTSRTHIALAIVPPAPPPGPLASVPLLDTSLIGAEPGLLAALRRFAPTLVIHVQDWAGGVSAGAPQSSGTSDSQEARLVESYFLDPDLHDALEVRGALRTRFGRPSTTSRRLDESPDARLGAGTAQYMRRMGFPARGWSTSNGPQPTGGEPIAVEVGPGRFVPRRVWRRLAGGNLAELALSTTGAPGLTLQLRGGSDVDRAGQALACIEGALVTRLRLDQEAA